MRPGPLLQHFVLPLILSTEHVFELHGHVCKATLELVHSRQRFDQLLAKKHLVLSRRVAGELLIQQLLAHTPDLRQRKDERGIPVCRLVLVLLVRIVLIII